MNTFKKKSLEEAVVRAITQKPISSVWCSEIDMLVAKKGAHREGLYVFNLPREELGGVLHNHYYSKQPYFLTEDVRAIFFQPSVFRVRQPSGLGVRAITIH